MAVLWLWHGSDLCVPAGCVAVLSRTHAGCSLWQTAAQEGLVRAWARAKAACLQAYTAWEVAAEMAAMITHKHACVA